MSPGRRVRKATQKLSAKARDEIGFRKKIKILREDPEALVSTIEEEGLELAEGADEIIERGGLAGAKTSKGGGSRAGRRREGGEDDQSSDESGDDEIRAYSDLFARIKTIESDAECNERKKSLIKVEFPSRDAALHSRFSDVGIGCDFADNLAMVSTQSVDLDDGDVDDEDKREGCFLKLAMEAFITGSKLCSKAGIPFQRPGDYYAEMIKDDEHMHKVRSRLVETATRIDTAEKTRRQRTLAKFGKKLQAERRLEREKKRSRALKSIESARKRGTLQNALDRSLEDEDAGPETDKIRRHAPDRPLKRSGKKSAPPQRRHKSRNKGRSRSGKKVRG